MAHSKPVMVFRIGAVSASVFTREVSDNKRIIHSVALQKRYVENDETKYTSSFGLADLTIAIRVLEITRAYVERHEAELNLE